MPNYTTNLNLTKPTDDEQYDVMVWNSNFQTIDDFAGLVPPRALTADKLTTGAKINGVNFKGDNDITIYDNTKSTINLDNLTSIGEKHFLNKSQITNCILEAPNGVMEYSTSNNASTIVAKTGLKLLIPNGRNSDGSLKNIEHTVTSPVSETIVDGYSRILNMTYDCYLTFDNNTQKIGFWSEHDFNIKNTAPSVNEQYNLYFNPIDNFYYFTNNTGSTWTPLPLTILGKATITFNNSMYGVISNLKPYKPVNLLKRTDKEEISSWAMPSNTYTNLTLGVSGTTYTAPSNGWYVVNKHAQPLANNNADIKQFGISNTTNGIYNEAHGNYAWLLTVLMPVKKNDVVMLDYSATGETIVFRFYYAQGSESEVV